MARNICIYLTVSSLFPVWLDRLRPGTALLLCILASLCPCISVNNFSKLKMKVLKTLSSIEWVKCEWQICTIPSVQLGSSWPPCLCVHLNGCSTLYGEAQLCGFVFYSSEICWEAHVMVLPRPSFHKIIPRWEPRLCTMAIRENHWQWLQPFSTHLQR